MMGGHMMISMIDVTRMIPYDGRPYDDDNDRCNMDDTI